MISGSYDYDAKLWDFGGMNSSFKPFRSWEVTEGHQVRCIDLGRLYHADASTLDSRCGFLVEWRFFLGCYWFESSQVIR